MRTIVAFLVLILVLCVGCSSDVPVPDENIPIDEQTEMPEESQDVEPLVEPLVPMTRSVADAWEKYAAEAVPLPPIEDLTAQVDAYIGKIAESLGYLEGSIKYAEDAADIARDANALALVALAIGLSDADSKYKKAAPHIIAATKPLADARNFNEGKAAYEALQASLSQPGDGQSEDGKALAWTDKVADLAQAMKALPNLSAAVKRIADTERKLNILLEREREQTLFSQLAAMAVISQGTIPNVAETAKPDAVAEWTKLCEEFRDAALKTNAAGRQYAKDKADGKEPNYADYDTHFKAMTESCDHCHQVFYPSALGQ